MYLDARSAQRLGLNLPWRAERDDHREAVLAREPRNPDAAFNLGNALRRLGRAREAAACFRLAADSRPGYADALNNLGNANKELGDFAAAMADAAQVGANTVFTIDANDTVTLDNVTKTSLTAGNFHFS